MFGTLSVCVALLMPVAVAWSTQRSGAAPRMVVRGSIAIALGEVIQTAGRFIGGADDAAILADAVIRVVGWLVFGAGLIWLANGLAAFRRHEPNLAAQRAGLAVITVGVVAAVLELGGRIVQLANVDADTESIIRWANLSGFASIAVVLGWTVIARALLHAGGDGGRPRRVRRAATIAGSLAGLWLLGGLLSTAVLLPLLASRDQGFASDSFASQAYFLVSVAVNGFRVLAIVYLARSLAVGLGSQGEDVGDSPERNDATLPAG